MEAPDRDCPSSLPHLGSARLAPPLSPALSLHCMNNGDTFIKPRCCYEIKAPFDAPCAADGPHISSSILVVVVVVSLFT